MLARISESATEYLQTSAGALVSARDPPPLDTVEATLEDYAVELAALRSERLTRNLPNDAVERIFALGFALEQLHQNFRDLERAASGNAPNPPPRKARSAKLLRRRRARQAVVRPGARFCDEPADKCLTPPNDGGLSLASIGPCDESVDAGSALAQARANLRNPRPAVVVHHP